MSKALLTIGLLVLSNIMMILAWYGHLKWGVPKVFSGWGMMGVIVFSWLIAFLEYCAQVPANRIGFNGNGGPFTLMQLKILQEVITLVVFALFSTLFFKNQPIKLNHLWAFLCLLGAVYFTFKK